MVDSVENNTNVFSLYLAICWVIQPTINILMSQ